MKTWAIVENGTVVNVVLWDGETDWKPKDHQEAIDISEGPLGASIGWSYVDGKLVGPEIDEDEDSTE